MKTRSLLLVSQFLIALALIIFVAGCASANQKNAGGFLSKVASMHVNVTDFSQETIGPFYNHAESVTAVAWDPTSKSFSVANLKASFNIPFPVFGIPLLSWKISASGISGSEGAAAGGALSIVTPGGSVSATTPAP